MGQHGKEGLAHFSRSKAIWKPRSIPMTPSLLCMAQFYKKDPAESSAAVRLSAVAFFTKLGGCSLLTCSVLSSWKKNPHRNVELGKDSRCPSYISCLGTFWKLLKKPEYSDFAHCHRRCFHRNPSSFPS